MGRDSLLTATRVHRRQTADKTAWDEGPLRAFVERAEMYADEIAIAVDGADEELLRRVRAIAFESARISVLPVTPWDNFTPALNALTVFAAKRAHAHILFQSVEVDASAAQVRALRTALADDTLVVGMRLEGHNFTVGGARALDGATTPWNTMAVWALPKLALTGFLMAADGVVAGVEGGVEEVTTIALHQMLRPDVSKAIVLDVASDHDRRTWATSWADDERRQWHQHKMATKVSRPQTQLQALRFPAATVLHQTWAAALAS